MSRRTSLAIAVAVTTAVVLPIGPAAAGSDSRAAAGDIPVQLLAMNDFHGRITPQVGSDGTLLTSPGPDGVYGTADDVSQTVGGAANVATTVSTQRAAFTTAGGQASASFFVGAGDLISASPFESSAFKDEPTIEVLNAMGLDFSSVGNHEFDRGVDELLRIDGGGCVGTPDVDSCFTDSTGDTTFDGADFPYLAANVEYKGTDDTILPPYEVMDVGGGQRMALIGVVTDSTPTLVSPSGITDVDFLDEAATINKYAAQLTDPAFPGGPVQAIGVLIHEGGQQNGTNFQDINGCNALSGEITTINAATSAAVDVIMSAHTHQAYNCQLADPAGNPRLVTQAGFYGKLVSDIRLGIDPATGDVDRAASVAMNVPVLQTNPDPAIAAIVDYWNVRSADAKNEVIGTQTAPILRGGTPSGSRRDVESSLGNLIADAQLAATDGADVGNAQLALMNPGGIRADLPYTTPDANGLDPVTFGEAFNVQPFGNTLATVTLTGAQIKAALEQQWSLNTDGSEKLLLLSVSQGFSYVYDPSRPIGDRVDPQQLLLDGAVLDPSASYRVTENSFLASGGDGFTVLAQGTDKVVGGVDVDALAAYITATSPVSPPALGRTVAGTFLPAAAGDLAVQARYTAVVARQSRTTPVTVTNQGAGGSTGPVTVTITAGSPIVASTAQPAGCAVSGTSVVCTMASGLAAGASVRFDVALTAAPQSSIVVLSSVTATVSGSEAAGASTSNNTKTVRAAVVTPR